MNSVEVSHVAKSFGKNQAVRDVSFAVKPGEIFAEFGAQIRAASPLSGPYSESMLNPTCASKIGWEIG